MCDSSVMQTTGCWLEALHRLLHCALRWKDCDFPVEPIEGGAGWPNHRRSYSALRGTLHRTDRGATIPWSSHPGEGRCSIRSRGNTVFQSLIWKGGIERKMSYQGKKNIPKITVSIRVISASSAVGTLMRAVANHCIGGGFPAQRRWITNKMRPPARLEARNISLHCQTWLQGAAGKNAHYEMAWLAAIVTGRQGDEAFS